MASGLDMSLDDMIAKNRKSGSSNPRDRPSAARAGSQTGPGPARRFPNRSSNRSTPYTTSKAPEATWQHDMYSDQANRASSIETGTKLYITNLDYGVSNEDIKELFAEVGDLKRYSVHYDRSGRSKGTAEIVFARRVDALAAFKKYNNVQLDGKPMKIEIVGTNLAAPGGPPAADSAPGNSHGVPRRGQGRGGAFRRQRGGGRSGRGRGRGKGPGEKVSAEDLDADLEKYHAEAMQTN